MEFSFWTEEGEGVLGEELIVSMGVRMMRDTINIGEALSWKLPTKDFLKQ